MQSWCVCGGVAGVVFVVRAPLAASPHRRNAARAFVDTTLSLSLSLPVPPAIQQDKMLCKRSELEHSLVGLNASAAEVRRNAQRCV